MNLLRMSNSIQIASPLKPLPLKEHRHQQEEAPSSSSLSQHRIVSPKKIEDQEQLELKEERVADACDDDDDDDGYHTPTSPSHRIPKATECPLAPKRPSLPQRYKKRKACFNVEIKDVQLFFVAEVDEEKRSKKAREEAVSIN